MNDVIRLDNISDLKKPPVPVVLEEEPLPTSIGEETLHLPIENDVDLKIEAELSAQAAHLREAGYRMFLDGAAPKKIAEKLGVSTSLVAFWAKDGEWADRMKKHNDVLEGVVRENVRRRRLEYAESEASDSLELGDKIRKRVKSELDNKDLSPLGIKNLADAAKSTGDLGAHGMGESTGARPEREKPESNGKTPLVLIVNGGNGLPPIVKVQEQDKEKLT